MKSLSIYKLDGLRLSKSNQKISLQNSFQFRVWKNNLSSLNMAAFRDPTGIRQSFGYDILIYVMPTSVYTVWPQSVRTGIPNCYKTPPNETSIQYKFFQHYQNDTHIISYVRRAINHFTLSTQFYIFGKSFLCVSWL